MKVSDLIQDTKKTCDLKTIIFTDTRGDYTKKVDADKVSDYLMFINKTVLKWFLHKPCEMLNRKDYELNITISL